MQIGHTYTGLIAITSSTMIASFLQPKARWQSGYAADCKSVYTGSTPVRASNFLQDQMTKPVTSPVVSTKELFELLKSAPHTMKILDASYALPGKSEDPKEMFAGKRIAGTQFFDIKEAADHGNSLPHMLPLSEEFATYASSLGLSNSDRIVIYGQSGMVMGPARAWWMFRVFGHDNVQVLDGGLPAWEVAGYPLETSTPTPAVPGTFSVEFRPELVVDMQAVRDASKTGKTQILDARAEERFSGAVPEPRPGLRSGHIPSSKNVPCASLVDSDGRLKSDSDLESIFKTAGFDKSKGVLSSCGSGVTACMTVLALHKLGIHDVPVYDGSWSEWGLAENANEIGIK